MEYVVMAFLCVSLFESRSPFTQTSPRCCSEGGL